MWYLRNNSWFPRVSSLGMSGGVSPVLSLRLPFRLVPRHNRLRWYNRSWKFLLEGCGMSRAARIGIVCVSVPIFSYVGIGQVLVRTTHDKAYKSLSVYGEVLQKVQQDYVDDPNMRTVTAGSLHGMLESLDAQSSYLTPREYDEYKKKFANAGIAETGLTPRNLFRYIILLPVLPDRHSTKAGMRFGDLFESIL